MEIRVYSVEGAVTTLSAVRGYSSDLHKICSRQRMHEHSLRFAVAALGGQVSGVEFRGGSYPPVCSPEGEQ